MFLLQVTVWFSIWFLYHATLNVVLIPRGISFRNKKHLTLLLEILAICLGLAIFGYSPRFVSALILLPLALLIEKIFLPIHSHVYSLRADRHKARKVSPLFVRYFDLVFQQFMLFYAVTVIFSSQKYDVFFAALLFTLGHLPILLVKRIPWLQRFYVVCFSFIGGTVFASIIHVFYFGLFYSLLVHFCCYFLIGVFTGDDDELLP